MALDQRWTMTDRFDTAYTAPRSGTLAFYEANAEAYAFRAAGADLSGLYRRFLQNLPGKARILDVGCGGGRDLQAFKELGHDPVGIDPSPAMAHIAKQRSGCITIIKAAEDLEFEAAFDGVWACASLLHLPRPVFPEALSRIRRALAPGGTLFLSMLPGEGEGPYGDGRYFTRYSASELASKVQAAGFALLDIWSTADSLTERRTVEWMNVLARRIESSVV